MTPDCSMNTGLNIMKKTDVYWKETLPALPVTDGVKDAVSLTQEQAELSLFFCPRRMRCAPELQLAESLPAPVEAGETAGWQNYYVNGELYAGIPVRTAERVEKRTFRYLPCRDPGKGPSVKKEGEKAAEKIVFCIWQIFGFRAYTFKIRVPVEYVQNGQAVFEPQISACSASGRP